MRAQDALDTSSYLVRDVTNSEQVIQIGNGYDSVSGTTKSVRCINFDAKKTADKTPPSSVETFNQTLSNSSDIQAALGLSFHTIFKTLGSEESFEGSISTRTRFQEDKITAVLRKTISQRAVVIDADSVNMKPLLKSEQKLTKSEQASSFKQRCGDYYIAGTIDGFRFFALAEFSKSQIDASLKAEANEQVSVSTPVASGSESIKTTAELSSTFRNKKAEIWEITKGGGLNSTKATDFDGLLQDYSSFPPQKTAPYPFKLVLAPYPDAPGNGASGDDAQLNDNAQLWYEYKQISANLLAALDTSKAATFYPFKSGMADRLTPAQIKKLRSAVDDQTKKIKSAISECERDRAKCTDLRASLDETRTPEAFRDQGPRFVGWPSSCADLFYRLSDSDADKLKRVDGEYTLFFNHDARFAYRAICRNMQASPATYLKLVYASAPTTETAGANFSEIAPTGSNENQEYFKGSKVVTVYRSIEIDPVTLQVKGGDLGIERTVGGIVASTDDKAWGGWKKADYAHPRQCDRSREAVQAAASVDVRGTGFKIDRTRTTLGRGGYNPQDGTGSVVYSDGDTRLSLAAPRGNPGAIDGELYLTPGRH